MAKYNDEHDMKLYNERHTYQGVVMSDFNKNYLRQHGWQLVKHENCGKSYVRSGEYFTGDTEVAYLDAYNENCDQIYQAETRIKPVESGEYRISCHARAEGPGVFIYALIPDGDQKQVVMTEVPHYGNTGGELWEQADEESDIRKANDGKGFGWSKVEVLIQVDDAKELVYGISTDSSFTGKPNQAQWFSACDFKAERVTN